ncbi:MAG: c-type cytochrome [Gemmatimonadaceae bacterium]
MKPSYGRETGDGSRGRHVIRLVVVALLALPAAGCLDWFTDFKRTPMVATWESDSLLKVRGAPQWSVPTTGTAVAAMQVSYLAMPATLDSISALVTNPTPPSEQSLLNGRKYYQMNCAVCHGNEGKGDGTAVRFGMIPMPIISDATKARTDGYLFGIIRNGRGAMPSYNRIEEMDRWDVVNYVRALQGVVTGVTFQTGPLAPPGVTGDKLPGPTRLGPNRWVPAVRAAGPVAADSAAPDTTAARPLGGR